MAVHPSQKEIPERLQPIAMDQQESWLVRGRGGVIHKKKSGSDGRAKVRNDLTDNSLSTVPK